MSAKYSIGAMRDVQLIISPIFTIYRFYAGISTVDRRWRYLSLVSHEKSTN
jgi:hypothetical protein